MHDTGSEPILVAKMCADVAVKWLARIEREPLTRETGQKQQECSRSSAQFRDLGDRPCCSANHQNRWAPFPPSQPAGQMHDLLCNLLCESLHLLKFEAITLLDVPLATLRRTSISRSVKASSATCSTIPAAISDGKRRRPAWIVRIVSMSSSRSILFRRRPWPGPLRPAASERRHRR